MNMIVSMIVIMTVIRIVSMIVSITVSMIVSKSVVIHVGCKHYISYLGAAFCWLISLIYIALLQT